MILAFRRIGVGRSGQPQKPSKFEAIILIDQSKQASKQTIIIESDKVGFTWAGLG